MRQITVLAGKGFMLRDDMVGVGTTTLLAPLGELFYFYNPRFCTTAEQAFKACAEQGIGVDRMTVPASSVDERWPYVILTAEQYYSLKDLAEKRERANRLRSEAHEIDSQVSSGFRNFIMEVGD